MTYSPFTATGDGSTTAYSIAFDYINTSDVKATVNNVATTAFTVSGSTVTFTTAPPSGQAIKIFRSTDNVTIQSDFQSGSALRAVDLNDNFTQLLYVTQESTDTSDEANTDAAAAVVTANSASTAATNAVNTANAASTAATSATNTANAASTAATNATNTANSAATDASNAVSTANTAASDASSAVSTANTASTNASNAVTTANTASTNATAAVNSANTAVSTANTASTNASNAVATANAASSNATTALNNSRESDGAGGFNTAIDKANTAVTTANTASTNASTAVSTANTASSNASTAVSTANTANATANAAAATVASAVLYTPVANFASFPSSPSNQDRIEVTDSTGLESQSIITGIPSGFTGSSDLTMRLEYNSSTSKWEFKQYFAEDPEARYMPLAGGTMTGDLNLGTSTNVVFEGSSADDYETTLTVTDPTADRTITLPNVTGTVVTTGDTGSVTSTMITDGTIVNADINASAEIAVSKLANGTAHQLLQTDSGGSGVEFTSNVDVPGTLDVTSAATFDSTVDVTGLLKIGTGSTVTPDGNADDFVIDKGAADTGLSILSTTTGRIYFGDAADHEAGSIRYVHTDNSLRFETASSEALRIDSSGRLLVGTTANTSVGNGSKLQIKGSGAADSSLSLIRTAAGGGEFHFAAGSSGTNVGNNNGLGFIKFLGYHTNGYDEYARIEAYVDGTNGDGDAPGRLVFKTSSDGSASPTERMRIDSSGTLTVGPQYDRLNVNPGSGSYDGDPTSVVIDGRTNDGNATAFKIDRYDGSGSASTKFFINYAGNVGIANTSPHQALDIGGTSTSLIKFTPSSYGTGATDGAQIGVNFGGLDVWQYENNYLRFGTNNTERVRIDSSGNVGIGITSPSQKLHVNGTAFVADDHIRLLLDSGNGRLQIRSSSDTTNVDIFGSNGQAFFAGNVGIGTTSPGHNLEVKGSFPDFAIVDSDTTNDKFRILHNGGATQLQVDPNNVSSSSHLLVSVDGSERMRIDSSGNLGIGLTSPQTRFHSAGTTNGAQATFGTASSGLKISTFQKTHNDAGVTLDAQHSTHGTLRFATTGTERLRIDSSGIVKIGTGSTVTPDGNADDFVIDKGAADTGLSILSTTTGRIYFGDAADHEAGSIRYVHTDNSLRFETASSEALRIDSSGNVGIGISNPGYRLEIEATANDIARFSGANTGNLVIRNATSNEVILHTGTSDALIFGTNGNNERMRIDSSGRLLVGTTSADLGNMSVASTAHTSLSIRAGSGNHNSNIFFADATSGNGAAVGVIQFKHSDNSLRISVDGPERMRITSDGCVLINGTSVVSRSQAVFFQIGEGSNSFGIQHNNSSNVIELTTEVGTTVARNHFTFKNSNGTVGSINTSGSSTAFNTSSDYRLKENIVDLNGAITRIKQLQPRRFNFIADDTTTVDGFIAHEAQTVVPEAVTGTHNEVDDDGNAVMQGIDQSKLVPLLTAALQEAIAKIETLEAKVAALEAE